MYASPNAPIYIYIISNIISIYCVAPSPKSWHITSKVCCPCQNGLCRTLPTTPQDQQQVLVHERISASNAPKHIFPHWDMTSEKPTKFHDKLFNSKNTPSGKTRLRYNIQTKKHLTNKSQNQLYIT